MRNLRFALIPAVLFLLPGLATPVFAQWEPDIRLTYNDSASWTSFNNAWCVATGPGGFVHVVWRDVRDGHWVVYYKRSTDSGSSWSQDWPLSNNPPQRQAEYPSIATADSLIHVVWEDDRDSYYGNPRIYYKRSSDAGVTWSADTGLVNDPNFSVYPSLATAGLGVHVVWEENRDGTGMRQIYYMGSTNGGRSWLPETLLTNDPNNSQGASVAVAESIVHVVWYSDRDGPPGNIEIYYKRSSDGGFTWSPDTRLTYDPNFSWDPSIAVSGPYVHVVWVDSRNGYPQIFYKHSTDFGITWATMDTPLTNVMSLQWDPNVVASGNNIHVVWDDNRDGGNNVEIYYKRSTDCGLSWSQDFRLTRDTSYSEHPFIAVMGPYVHVVWMDSRCGNWEIFYKRNPTGNLGVENTRFLRVLHYLSRLTVSPNPFTSFATVPGHEAERFALYDITGRNVGTYKGERIGEGLAAGVYFLRTTDGSSKPLRIVKLR